MKAVFAVVPVSAMSVVTTPVVEIVSGRMLDAFQQTSRIFRFGQHDDGSVQMTSLAVPGTVFLMAAM